MSEFDLGIHGATVVGPSRRARLHLYVHQGRVAAVSPERRDAATTVDATGLYLLPGMVDTHVHLMDPGATEREDFPTGTAAAAVHGVTTIVEHTHGHPVRTVQELERKRWHLRSRSHVDYGLAAHVWPDQIGRLGELWAAGVAFFKIFTCTTHGVPGLDAAHLLAALEDLARAGAAALIHCEDDTITGEAERALRKAGRDDGAVLLQWRSREAELVATQVAALLSGITGAHATIAHVSHPAVADRIAAERAAGADVAAEACPQYFLLREDEVLEKGAFRKFTPPARARTDADEDAMWDRLRSGVLTHVSTDHAPATRQQKAQGIWEAAFGLPGLDTTLPLLIDAALRGKLALEDVVRAYAEGPARRYGLWPRKGTLAPGADADLVLVDPGPTS
ncbi:MAG TPA: dihydroorotase family protein, partial [Actinomycetota bacterium]|nr:dihydroorotase family protein [Actinomycetota bacterium]